MGKKQVRPVEMQPERLTEELLERLLASATPEAYLAQAELDDRSLVDYLWQLTRAYGLTRAVVAHRSKINSSFVYEVYKGNRRLGRDNAIRVAFALGCTLRETQRLLRHDGVSELWCKDRRDAIIIHCLQQGLSLSECDDELYRLGEATLVPREG